MYGIERLNVEIVFSLTSQKEIWKKYIGDFTLNKKMSCPYRRDNNPSFGIYEKHGVYKFSDFSSGESGDIFGYLMLTRGLSFYQALETVYADFISVTVSATPYTTRTQIEKPVEQIKIEVKRREWNTGDLDYWHSYGITKEILDKFNVSAVTHVWYGGKIVSTEGSRSPIYAYWFAPYTYKIYRPCEKEWKWFSNAGKTVQGWRQLPEKGEVVVITKALKDVMVFHAIGVTAVAPQSENTILPEATVRELKERFGEVLVWMDNDDPGIIAASKYAEKYGLRTFVTPEEKDPSDYVKRFTQEKFKVLWQQALELP